MRGDQGGIDYALYNPPQPSTRSTMGTPPRFTTTPRITSGSPPNRYTFTAREALGDSVSLYYWRVSADALEPVVMKTNYRVSPQY